MESILFDFCYFRLHLTGVHCVLYTYLGYSERAIKMLKKTVSVEFGGNIEEVDISTFYNVILAYTETVKASAKYIDPDIVINTRIKAVKYGCLTVDLSIVGNVIENLFKDPQTSLNTINGAVGIASGIYGLVRWFGKHKEVRGYSESNKNGKVTITASDGAQITVDESVTKVYMMNDKNVKKVSSSFNDLDSDGDIASISFSDENGEVLYSATKEEFKTIAEAPLFSPTDTKEIVREHVLVNVQKVVFDLTANNKWDFIYDGFKISARIFDDQFMTKELPETSFRVGTTMKVDLVLVQKYSNREKGYVNVEYKIIKVYEVIQPCEQDHLPIQF